MDKLVSIECTGLGSIFLRNDTNFNYSLEYSHDGETWLPVQKYVSRRAPLQEQELTSGILCDLIRKSKEGKIDGIDFLVSEDVRQCKLSVLNDKGQVEASAEMAIEGEF